MTAKIAIPALAAALISCAVAYAHNGATGIVKQRMDAMGVLAKATKSLAETVPGRVPYDAKLVRHNAKQIRQHAGESLTNLYPADSLMKPSEASQTIWSE